MERAPQVLRVCLPLRSGGVPSPGGVMPSVSRVLSAAALVVTVLLVGQVAYGQGGATGAITGSVVDASGGSVAGADVQIIDTRTDVVVRKLPTGSDGSFVVPLLPPGTYKRAVRSRSEEHTSELQSLAYLVCRHLLEKKEPSTPHRLYFAISGNCTLLTIF